MENLKNINEVSRLVFVDGVCSFQNHKKAVLQLNGLTRMSRPQAKMSPAFISCLATSLSEHLRVDVTVETLERGFTLHFSGHPPVQALKNATPLVLILPTLGLHVNRAGLEVVEWMLRALFSVTFTVTQTTDTARFEPPRPPTRYSTPPLKSISKEPEQPASSKRKK